MRKYFAPLLVLALGVLMTQLVPSPDAHAADNGNQISDGVFGNETSMSEAQINNFINSFPRSCLKPENYPAGLSPVSFLEPINYSSYGGQVSAARVIYKSAILFHLNPQVILATLEKEQNLVTGNAGCSTTRYNSAMGYNCPDGSENSLKDYPNIGIYRTCVARESNAGFARQVSHAAWQLRFDKERAYGNTDWGGDGSITYVGRMTEGNRARVKGGPVAYYDGFTTIDGVSFKIQNGATAALYNYTPHFNSFNRIFTGWFGATDSTYIGGCAQATNTSLSCVWKAQRAGGGENTTTSYEVINDWVNRLGYSYLGMTYLTRNPISPASGNVPVYSMIKPDGSTFLTTDLNEYNTVGFQKNGVIFYADPAGSNSGYPVYRMYNSNTGQHAWTTDRATYQTNGYSFEKVAYNSLSPVRQETAPAPGRTLVYRFYVAATYSHLWTTDLWERDNMINAGYKYEGVAWHGSASTNDLPVYRLYAPSLRQHLYTTDAYERSVLAGSGGWNDEGIAFYASRSGTTPVYRLYAPSLGVHHLTLDAYERSVLLQSGKWSDEAVAWYQ